MQLETQSFASNHRSLAGRVRRGFTILEILIVIALIAALAGASIVALDKLFGQGQEQIVEIFVNDSISPAMMAYRLKHGKYPSTADGLAAVREFLEEDPIDPWGNPYQYKFPGTHNTEKYDVWSFGPDGVESADDIGNWK